MAVERKLINIIFLSLGFWFIFLGSISNILEVLYSSIHEENPNFTADGFYVWVTFSTVAAITTWFAPALVTIYGPKLSLVTSSITYILYIGIILVPFNSLVYFTAGLNGFGSSLLWVTQGVYITINSDEKTISRHTGIFWAIYKSSAIPGQIFFYFAFRNVAIIKKEMRVIVFSILTVATAISIPFFYGIKIIEGTYKGDLGPLTVFKRSFTLLKKKTMLLLLVPFTLSGLLLCFDFAVYGVVIAYTQKLNNQASSFRTLYLLFFGAGSIISASIPGIIGVKIIRWGRYPMVVIGLFITLVGLLLTFLNLPKDSPLIPTNEDALIKTTAELTLFCAFLLGFGDSFFQIELIAIISVAFVDDCSSAFAIYRFLFNSVSVLALIYSSYLNLYWQIAILSFFCIFSAICYYLVERLFEKEKLQKLIDAEADKKTKPE